MGKLLCLIVEEAEQQLEVDSKSCTEAASKLVVGGIKTALRCYISRRRAGTELPIPPNFSTSFGPGNLIETAALRLDKEKLTVAMDVDGTMGCWDPERGWAVRPGLESFLSKWSQIVNFVLWTAASEFHMDDFLIASGLGAYFPEHRRLWRKHCGPLRPNNTRPKCMAWLSE